MLSFPTHRASSRAHAAPAFSVLCDPLACTILPHANPPDPTTLVKIAMRSVPVVSRTGQWEVLAASAAQTFAAALVVTKQAALIYRLQEKL